MPGSADYQHAPERPHRRRNTRGHILVVDDDLEIAETIRYALKNEDYEVSTAADGNTCLAITESKNPDLIILDLMMPKRSGLLVLERLRQFYDRPIPVIVITGNEGNRHREYAELLGVSDYLFKPFTMDRLLASVGKLLDTDSVNDSTAAP